MTSCLAPCGHALPNPPTPTFFSLAHNLMACGSYRLRFDAQVGYLSRPSGGHISVFGVPGRSRVWPDTTRTHPKYYIVPAHTKYVSIFQAGSLNSVEAPPRLMTSDIVLPSMEWYDCCKISKPGWGADLWVFICFSTCLFGLPCYLGSGKH